MKAWKTVSRQIVLDRAPYLRVEDHVVELPDGQVIEDWPWIVTPDFASILAVTEDGKFLVFRQTKYSVQGVSLAPAGGYINAGEDPLLAAQRELLEETGYTAGHWMPLGSYPVDGNRGAGTAHLFLASGARRVAESNADDLEEQELLLLSRDEIDQALRGGAFKLLPWMALIALSLHYLVQENSATA